MQVVNPYYARESAVGPVFDVGTFVARKWYSPVTLVALTFATACAATAAVLLLPDLLEHVRADAVRRAAHSLQLTLEKGHTEYPWAMWGGAALAMALTYLFLAVCVAGQAVRFQGSGYLRVGPGGMSLRVPDGLDSFLPWYKFLELDAACEDIEDYRIVQHKQMGSLSPNAGNLYAMLHLQLSGGTKRIIDLSWFREPARIIWTRIQDSVEMVPMDFAPEPRDREQDAAELPCCETPTQQNLTG